MLIDSRPSFGRRFGLWLQPQLQHFFAEDLADFDYQVFEFAKFRSPRRSVSSPETIGQVFGDAFEVVSCLFDLGTAARSA